MTPASAQVPVAQATFSGYASGTAIHLGAVTSGSTTVANVDQAFSGSVVNSAGLPLLGETELADHPQLSAADPSHNSEARGSGAEVGVLPPGDPLTNQIVLAGLATAVAPPSSGPITKTIDIPLGSVLSASLLKGVATAHYNPNGCYLGADLANGMGEAADAAVLGTGAQATVFAPGDSTTTSREVMVPQQDINGATVGSGVGLMSESYGTVAPVALLSGALTVKVIGGFGLQAVATGVAGTAYARPIYPSAVEIDAAGGVPILTVPLGPNGLSLPTTTLLGAVTLGIAAAPHALTGESVIASADGTHVDASMDIVQVTASLGGINIADVRIGHMEASATVPSGGIDCQIDVSKTAQPSSVNPGDTFQYLISVHNPHACTLVGVKVVDTVTTTSGVKYQIVSEAPTADSASGGTLTWNDIGPINPGDTKQLVVNMKVLTNSAGGTFTETATATAQCAIANAQGQTSVANTSGGATLVSATGGTTINSPTVGGLNGKVLPVTGGLDGRYYAVALLVGLAAVAAGRKGLLAFGARQ